MAEPWLVRVNTLDDIWYVEDHEDGQTFSIESAARRYAALPVLLATIREACGRNPCAFCSGVPTFDGTKDGFDTGCPCCDEEQAALSEIIHSPDCPGIAVLKAAGEEP